MSASFYWQPLKEGRSLKRGTSSNIEKLNAVFGPAPWRLSEEQLPLLRSMQVASGDSFYGELVDLVEDHGPIQVEVRF